MSEKPPREPYREARITAAMLLIALVVLRGLLDIFVGGSWHDDSVYPAILLGAALGLLGIARWGR